MDLTIDDDIQLRTRSGELLTVNIPDLTCNVEVEDGRVYVTHVWIKGRPWPQRGGETDLFEYELVARIITAIQLDWADVIRRKWSEDRDERRATSRGIQPFTGA